MSSLIPIIGDLIPAVTGGLGKVVTGVGGAIAKDPLGALAALASVAAPFFLGDDGDMMASAPSSGSGGAMSGMGAGQMEDPTQILRKLEMAAAMGNPAAAALMQAMSSAMGGGGPTSCPQLFRSGRTGAYLPSRIQVQGPNGQVYILANLGRATRGSRETSVMKRLAKQNGFVTRRRTSSGG